MPESIAEGNLYSGDEVDEQETTSKGSTVVVLLNNVNIILYKDNNHYSIGA